MKPCLRCLGRAFVKIVRTDQVYYIVQCEKCGFNYISTHSMNDAKENWNKAKVWDLVEAYRQVAIHIASRELGKDKKKQEWIDDLAQRFLKEGFTIF